MSVLVTGANGFLGSWLVKRLAEQGVEDLRCLVRPGSDRSKLAAATGGVSTQRFSLVAGSLDTPDKAREVLEGVDTVYHLAAAMSGQAADMFLGTVVASKNLLEAASKLPKPPRIVMTSSFSVYGVGNLPRRAVVDENTPLEPSPAQRDLYAQTKLRQEQLFWEYQKRVGFELVVLRPGVIYGPGGGGLSSRIGLQLPGLYLRLGHNNVLPLSYVENCADAIALAGQTPAAANQVYNVHDDDLPTCDQYFRAFQREVGPLRNVPVPYPLLMLGSLLVEKYHSYSQGQLPAFFTRYRTAALWKGNRFDNSKLKALGWAPRVSTEEGMRRTFAYLKALPRRA